MIAHERKKDNVCYEKIRIIPVRTAGEIAVVCETISPLNKGA